MAKEVYRYQQGSYCHVCRRAYFDAELLCPFCGAAWRDDDGRFEIAVPIRFRRVPVAFDIWKPSTWFRAAKWVVDGVGQKEGSSV